MYLFLFMLLLISKELQQLRLPQPLRDIAATFKTNMSQVTLK